MNAGSSFIRLAGLAALLLGMAAAAPALAQSPASPPAQSTPAPSSDQPAVGGMGDTGEASGEIGAIQQIDLQPRPSLALDGDGKWDEGLPSIVAALDKLRDEMAKAGLQPGGKPLAVFTETDDQGFKFTAMLPLAAKPATAPTLGQNVRLAETPAGKAMKFEHRGSYEEIDTSYEAITAYLDEKGLEAQNQFIEEYLTMPKGADDTDLEVDIYVFLKQ